MATGEEKKTNTTEPGFRAAASTGHDCRVALGVKAKSEKRWKTNADVDDKSKHMPQIIDFEKGEGECNAAHSRLHERLALLSPLFVSFWVSVLFFLKDDL